MSDAAPDAALEIQVRPRDDAPAPSEATTLALGPAVQIDLGGLRCPFCREAVPVNQHEQLACNRCRAWHHQACWTEAGGRCSACGGERTGVGVASAPAPSDRPAPLRRATPQGLGRLPVWLWGLACCLVLLSFLVSQVLLLVDVLQDAASFAYLLGALLSGSASAWIALVTAYTSWPDPDDPRHLRLLGYEGARSARARAALAQRFAQSREAARATGLSLTHTVGVDLLDARVVCAERVANPRDLLSVLVPLSADAYAPPLVLVVNEVSDEVLELFQVNAENAVLPGCVLRASSDELREVARVTDARLVREGSRVRCRDVGVARVRVDARTVDFLTPDGVAGVTFRPPGDPSGPAPV